LDAEGTLPITGGVSGVFGLGIGNDQDRLPGAVSGDTPRGSNTDEDRESRPGPGPGPGPISSGAISEEAARMSTRAGCSLAIRSLQSSALPGVRLEAPSIDHEGTRWCFDASSAAGRAFAGLPCWARAHGVVQLLLAGSDSMDRPCAASARPSSIVPLTAPGSNSDSGPGAANGRDERLNSKVSLRQPDPPVQAGGKGGGRGGTGLRVDTGHGAGAGAGAVQSAEGEREGGGEGGASGGGGRND